MTIGALMVARTGLDAQNTKMRVIANNLANVNTTGFKRLRAQFETLAYQHDRTPGAPATGDARYAVGRSLGTGVSIQGTARMVGQGTLQNTGNAFDLAVQGNGYFQVEMADGRTGYTRAGNFNLTADGNLVTAGGRPIIPAINVPNGSTSITVSLDGTISAIPPGQNESQILGQIETTAFINPAGLTPDGDNILLESDASGPPQNGPAGIEGRGVIRQAMLEQSNVNVVEELVNMIETQRSYEVNSKMIQATDEMLQFVNQQL